MQGRRPDSIPLHHGVQNHLFGAVLTASQPRGIYAHTADIFRQEAVGSITERDAALHAWLIRSLALLFRGCGQF
jgi:hypothetical protein